MTLRNGRFALWLVVLGNCFTVACGAAGDGLSRPVTATAATASTSTSSTEQATVGRTASGRSSSSDLSSTSALSKSWPSEPTRIVTPSPATTPPPPTPPVLIIRWQSTGGSCADEHTLVPKLVVYADGRVIRTDNKSLGQYCDPLPLFREGFVDLVPLRAKIEAYLGTQFSKIDMSQADGVADAGLTVLQYTSGDGSRRSIAADSINFGLDQMTVEQRSGRAALAATIAAVDKLTPTATRWTPSVLSVSKPAKWVPRYSSAQKPPWPIRITPAIEKLSVGVDGSCTTVTGPAAATLLTAARTRSSAAATWSINGRPAFLAIGAVIDGFQPCG